MAKLLENIFRSVNIALVNELAILADRMGIDIWEVIDAASTKPYGFMRFEPGPGMGGHCLPVDPFYLTWRAREFHMSDRVHRARRQGQPADALLLRRAHRARPQRRQEARQRVADRDPGRQLQGRRRRHRASHPRCASWSCWPSAAPCSPTTTRTCPPCPSSGCRARALRAVSSADAVVLVTAHPEVDHSSLVESSRLFVDLRGATRKLAAGDVVRL